MKARLLTISILLLIQGSINAQSWESIGPYGGDRHFIYQNPNDPNILYTGGAGGFVHQTQDLGNTWTSLSDTLVLGQTKVEAVIVEFNNSNNVLTNAYNTIGMLKSTDGGQSWTQMNNGLGSEKSATTFAAGTANPSGVFAGIEVLGNNFSNGGCYYSSDFGDSWSPRNNNLPLTKVTRIFSDNVDDFYACTLDGLFHWNDLNSQWDDLNFPKDSVSILKVSPANDSVLFVGTTSDWIYTSTDKGNTWAQLPKPSILVNALASVCYSIDVDPQNPNIVIARLFQSQELPFYPQAEPNAINGTFYSADGGNSWSLLSSVSFSQVFIDGSSPLTTSLPVRSSRIFLTGGGQSCILGSTDGGVTFVPKIEGIAALYSNRVVLNDYGQVVNHSEAVITIKENNQNTWNAIDYQNTVADKNGYHWDVAFNPQDSTHCLIVKGEYSHGLSDGKGVYSHFLGSSSSNKLPGTAESGFMQIEIGNTLDTIFLASHSSGVWESFDGGNSWNILESGLLEKTVQKMHISQLSGRPKYCITRADSVNWFSALTNESGGFYIWDDLNQIWNPSISILPPVAMSDMWVSENDSIIYITTFNNGIYKSTNKGISWSYLSLPFSNENLFCVTSSELNPNFVVVGDKNKGVWYSEDGGVLWLSLNENSLICPSINDIKLDPNGAIYAATLGGSIMKYYDPLILGSTEVVVSDVETFNLYPNPTTGIFNLTFSNQNTNLTYGEIYSLQGVKMSTMYLNPSQQNSEFDLSNYPNGVYLLHLFGLDKVITKKIIKTGSNKI